jgi:hypothetical protein
VQSSKRAGSVLVCASAVFRKVRVKEFLIEWELQLLGVHWPGSALVRLNHEARNSEILAASGQSGAGPPHSRELIRYLIRASLSLNPRGVHRPPTSISATN